MRSSLAVYASLAAVLAISLPSAVHAVPDPQSGGAMTNAAAIQPAVPETAEAPLPVAPKPVAITLNADINLTSQQLTVSSGGKVLHVWPISSGTREHATPTGTFRPQWTAKMWYSKKYDDAPMPHSVFFNGGIATHATQSVSRLGSPASHGCIRLTPSAAATFYALVQKHGLKATKIVVHGSPRFRDEVASRRDRGGDQAQNTARSNRSQATGYSTTANAYGSRPAYRAANGYYAAPRQVYVQPWPGDAPSYGQVRYLPRGYVRY